MEPGVVRERVRIFDTTLRDGEQAPGCTMTLDEKMSVARQLARLGVDIIEAGFPAASPGDWAAVNQIAREVGTADGPVITALARAVKDDIEKAGAAIQPAAKKRIHTFISTSDIHIEHQMRSTREVVLKQAREAVRLARSLCEDVEFSPMDASRSDPEYMYQVLAAVIEEGATTLNIPDTVGYATPEEYGAMIAGIIEHVPGARNVIISTHCHDDLGLAVANSLAGVRAGARQIECTINGIGERAGNASLEEVVMAIHTRSQFFEVETGIATRELTRASRMVSSYTGVAVPPNKAIVGANAFAHESGIHQDGLLKNRMTYEIISPEVVGLEVTEFVLGKHSGRHALRNHLAQLGYHLDDETMTKVFQRFKELCDRKKRVDDRDIEALITDEWQHTPDVYVLEHIQAMCGSNMNATATVRLRDREGQVYVDSAHGTGPVDAAYKAINRIIGRPSELIEFSISAITEGLDAVAKVTVRISDKKAEAENSNGHEPSALQQPEMFPGGEALAQRRRTIYSGYGVNTDTVVAAAEAYMGALNKLISSSQEQAKAEATAYASGYDRSHPSYAVDTFGRASEVENTSA